jgi:hypothetical protein
VFERERVRRLLALGLPAASQVTLEVASSPRSARWQGRSIRSRSARIRLR